VGHVCKLYLGGEGEEEGDGDGGGGRGAPHLATQGPPMRDFLVVVPFHYGENYNSHHHDRIRIPLHHIKKLSGICAPNY
jgi:hypothetical protein